MKPRTLEDQKAVKERDSERKLAGLFRNLMIHPVLSLRAARRIDPLQLGRSKRPTCKCRRNLKKRIHQPICLGMQRLSQNRENLAMARGLAGRPETLDLRAGRSGQDTGCGPDFGALELMVLQV